MSLKCWCNGCMGQGREDKMSPQTNHYLTKGVITKYCSGHNSLKQYHVFGNFI
jgi:hypothetical protein